MVNIIVLALAYTFLVFYIGFRRGFRRGIDLSKKIMQDELEKFIKDE